MDDDELSAQIASELLVWIISGMGGSIAIPAHEFESFVEIQQHAGTRLEITPPSKDFRFYKAALVRESQSSM